jgi:hypothetical protein
MKQIIILLMFVAFIGVNCMASPTVSPTKATYGLSEKKAVTFGNTKSIDSNINTPIVASDYTIITYEPLVYSNYSTHTRWYNKPTSFKLLDNSLYAKGKGKGGKKGSKGKKC